MDEHIQDRWIRYKKILKLFMAFFFGWFIGTLLLFIFISLGFNAMKSSGESMMPTLNGDCIHIVKTEDDYKIGDIIVFALNPKIKIVHRIIDVCEGGFVTRGDGNDYTDGCIPADYILYKSIWHICWYR